MSKLDYYKRLHLSPMRSSIRHMAAQSGSDDPHFLCHMNVPTCLGFK
jgi:hypothetical protein